MVKHSRKSITSNNRCHLWHLSYDLLPPLLLLGPSCTSYSRCFTLGGFGQKDGSLPALPPVLGLLLHSQMMDQAPHVSPSLVLGYRSSFPGEHSQAGWGPLRCPSPRVEAQLQARVAGWHHWVPKCSFPTACSEHRVSPSPQQWHKSST